MHHVTRHVTFSQYKLPIARSITACITSRLARTEDAWHNASSVVNIREVMHSLIHLLLHVLGNFNRTAWRWKIQYSNHYEDFIHILCPKRWWFYCRFIIFLCNTLLLSFLITEQQINYLWATATGKKWIISIRIASRK